MKKYLFLILVLFPFNTILAQTNSEGLNTSSVISIDLNDDNPKPDKIFPFDKPFIIRIKNIKEVYNYASIEIRTNKKALIQFKSKASLTKSEQNGDTLLFEWNRAPGSKATVGDAYSYGTLPPNSSYILTTTVGTKSPLNQSQETSLINRLTNDSGISNIINTLTKENEENVNELVSNSRDEIIKLAKNAVEKADPTYVYGNPDKKALIKILGRFHAIGTNLPPQIADLKEEFTTDSLFLNILNTLSDQVKEIDWGTISKSHITYHDLIETIDSLDEGSKKLDNYDAINSKLETLKEEIDSSIDTRDKVKKSLIADVLVKNIFSLTGTNTTYDTNFLNNTKSYITLDIGAAYVGKIDRISWYTGINIFLRPVDKSIPLSNYRGVWNQLLIRTSILIGVSLASIEKENVRKGLIDDKALVLGAGFRVWSFLKVNGGFFCHYRYDQNPVIDSQRYHFSTSPFVSFSIDADVKTLFSGISQSIFK